MRRPHSSAGSPASVSGAAARRACLSERRGQQPVSFVAQAIEARQGGAPLGLVPFVAVFGHAARIGHGLIACQFGQRR